MFPTVIELVRRLVAVVATLAGVWMVLWSAGELTVVRLVDFERDFANDPYFHAKDETLSHWVARRTEGRSQVVEDAAWREFAHSLELGAPENSLQRLDGTRGPILWVFSPEALPALPESLNGVLSYLSIPSLNAWISLDRRPAQEISGLDGRIVYPQRRLGLLLLGAGLLVYFFLPKGKLPAGALVYSRGAAVVGPDLLGLLGGAGFFALPLLIIGENVPGQLPWSTEGGWHILTIVLWSMAALCLSLVVVGYFYSTLSIVLTDRCLELRKGFRGAAYAWDEMEACGEYHSNRGKIMGFLLVVLANSPGMVGQGLLVASNEECGLEIRMADGRTVKVMANSFPGYLELVGALREHGISGSDTIEI